jgi:hypothetical protein
MTCPNDNGTQDSEFKVNRDLLGETNDLRSLVLDDMKERNTRVLNNYNMSPSNPLVSTAHEISLFYIKPNICENDEDLNSGYANNISLVLFCIVSDKTLLLPGDISKQGMKYLIDGNINFKKLLSRYGVDYLIAPHHGLETSFSEYLFQNISGNKTKLNIISEKVRKEDQKENRSDVDNRYYSQNYSTGENALNQNAVKTSMGHLVIDFENEVTDIRQYLDIKDVINEFTN